jgi:hypothetical protein
MRTLITIAFITAVMVAITGGMATYSVVGQQHPAAAAFHRSHDGGTIRRERYAAFML